MAEDVNKELVKQLKELNETLQQIKDALAQIQYAIQHAAGLKRR